MKYRAIRFEKYRAIRFDFRWQRAPRFKKSVGPT